MFESIISRPAPPPPAPFVLSSMLVEKKKSPLKASTVLNKAAPSGQTLVNIAKDLKLFRVNQLGPKRHIRDDPVYGTFVILDMAFITQGLSSRDISFSVADDHMGSDHFPIQISLDKPLKRNTPLTIPNHVTNLTKQMMTYYTTH